jgi:hypothetical protein
MRQAASAMSVAEARLNWLSVKVMVISRVLVWRCWVVLDRLLRVVVYETPKRSCR